MQSTTLFSKSVKWMPLLIPQRWKVRKLPKIYDPEYETEYMPLPKPRRSIYVDFLSFVQRKWSLENILNALKVKDIENIKEDQTFMPERHEALGSDLATTHFFAARGAKIKFVNSNEWITQDEIDKNRVPSFYMPGFFVEEIDASGMNLLYEGFDNLRNLTRLKKLTLRNCPNIDDWCLSRTYLLANTLEYLDISGCHLVTERGICTLHVLKKLKTLVVHDTPNIQNKELVFLLLQDVLPKCDIIGVDYSDPVLLQRIEKYMD